jgi:O-antigen/teichoic acid export membrane protein
MLEKVHTRSFLLMVAHSFVIICNAGAHFLLAAILTPETYGSIFFFLTALNFILMAAMFGFQHLIMHQGPRLEEQKNFQGLTALVYDSWSVCVILGFAFALLLAVWHFFVMPISMPGANGAVLSLLIIAPLWAFIRIVLPFLLSRGASFAGVLPDQGMQALGLILMVFIIYIFGLEWENVPLLLSGQIIVGGVASFLVYHYAHCYFKELNGYKFSFWKPLVKWRHLNMPFFLFSLSQQAVQRLDLLLIGILAGPKDLAIYAIALKIAQILNFPAMASKAALAPRFSMLFAQKNFNEIRKLLVAATIALGCIGAVVGGALYLLSPFILKIVGGVYQEYSLGILPVLIAAEILICIFTPIKINALMGNSQKFLSIIFFVGLLLSVALNTYVIPIYGIGGAAFVRLAVIFGIHMVIVLGVSNTMLRR